MSCQANCVNDWEGTTDVVRAYVWSGMKPRKPNQRLSQRPNGIKTCTKWQISVAQRLKSQNPTHISRLLWWQLICNVICWCCSFKVENCEQQIIIVGPLWGDPMKRNLAQLATPPPAAATGMTQVNPTTMMVITIMPQFKPHGFGMDCAQNLLHQQQTENLKPKTPKLCGLTTILNRRPEINQRTGMPAR